mmetsp:Transcript_71720/g.233152  ORF Transcript_71720/g.233152 Transcript_71720/m.233152 type:complete len:201 (+) Transcript_71720:1575-2177(+)
MQAPALPGKLASHQWAMPRHQPSDHHPRVRFRGPAVEYRARSPAAALPTPAPSRSGIRRRRCRHRRRRTHMRRRRCRRRRPPPEEPWATAPGPLPPVAAPAVAEGEAMRRPRQVRRRLWPIWTWMTTRCAWFASPCRRATPSFLVATAACAPPAATRFCMVALRARPYAPSAGPGPTGPSRSSHEVRMCGRSHRQALACI